MRRNTAREKFMGTVFAGFAHCKSELPVEWMAWKLNTSSRLCHLRSQLWLQVLLNFTDNSPCLYVSTVPSKSRRKDNSALLELCQTRSGVWIMQPWNSKTTAIFVNHCIELGPPFPMILLLSCPDRVAYHSLFSSQVKKTELEDSEKLCFFAREKKNCKQRLWADVSVLYGDLKNAWFVSLDQSENVFYLPHSTLNRSKMLALRQKLLGNRSDSTTSQQS